MSNALDQAAVRRKRREYTLANRPEKELLEELYLEQFESPEMIAGIMGISIRSVYARLKEHGLSRVNRYPEQNYCPTCGHRRTDGN